VPRHIRGEKIRFVMRRAAAKHRREDDDEDEHQQQRMEHRPEEAEDRALVADGEIAVDELEEQPGVRANVASLAHPSQRLAGDTSALDEGNGRHPAHVVRERRGRIKPSTIRGVWTRGAGRPIAERPQTVDVIIPVYGAADDLRRCLASVIAETDLTRHRVVLVIDGPQDEEVESIVRNFNGTILRNDHRLGFAASVNRGMSASTNDVVLLNSDTIVTARWLEKLIDAAYSNGD